MYKIIVKSKFRNFTKKINDKKLKDDITEAINCIQKNPFNVSNKLTGNWKNGFSYHFGRKPEYRIIYKVEDCFKYTNKNNILDCSYAKCDKKEIKECKGLIVFCLIDRREAFNNLYTLNKNGVKDILSLP